MEQNGISFRNTISVEEFLALRRAVGFQPLTEDQARAALENTPLLVCAVWEGRAVGVVRVLTDLVTDAYLTDVIVSPEVQGRGVGKMMLRQVTDRLKACAPAGVTLACSLYANPGKEPFYEKHGFERLPGGKYGCGMLAELRET